MKLLAGHRVSKEHNLFIYVFSTIMMSLAMFLFTGYSRRCPKVFRAIAVVFGGASIMSLRHAVAKVSIQRAR